MIALLTNFVILSSIDLGKAGTTVTFDLASNGRSINPFFWGQPWEHLPGDGSTNDCICARGTRRDNFKFDVECRLGIPGNTAEVVWDLPFYGRYPIELSTDGDDAVWFDRIGIKMDGKFGDQCWFGQHNTDGHCLSKDKDDRFDWWSHLYGDQCYQILSFRLNTYCQTKTHTAYDEREGLLKEQQACGALRRERGRRREELEEPGSEIDSVLNSAMLDVEHSVERSAHEGGVREDPEALDDDLPAGTRNVQNRLQHLEEDAVVDENDVPEENP